MLLASTVQGEFPQVGNYAQWHSVKLNINFKSKQAKSIVDIFVVELAVVASQKKEKKYQQSPF